VRPWIDSEGISTLGRFPGGWHSPESVPADVRDALPALIEQHRAALVPAPRNFLVTHMARLAAHFPMTRSEAEWKMLFEDYCEDLAEIPPDILVEAIRAYRRKGKFFPKVAELLEEAAPLLSKRRAYVRRMEKLMRLPTPEEKAAAEEAENERREAEWREKVRTTPHLRVFERWRHVEPFRSWGMAGWMSFLRDAVELHGEDVVNAWHEEVAARPSEPWPYELAALRAMSAAATMATTQT